MAVTAIVGKVSFGQLAFPIGLTVALLAMPPAIGYLIWQTMPGVAADFIAIWQASPVFLVLMLICAGIMMLLLPVIVVWGLWVQWLQRSDRTEPIVAEPIVC